MLTIRRAAHVLAVVALATPVLTATSIPPEAVERSVRGELIDQTCYLKGNVGPAHLECAMICAKRGAPLGVLTADGKIFVVSGDLAKNNGLKLRPYVGRQVDVTGRTLQQRGGKLYLMLGELGKAYAPGPGLSVDDINIKGRILQQSDGLIIEGREIKPVKTPS